VPHRNHQEHGVLVFGRDETVTWFSQQTNYVAGHGSNIAGIHCKSLGDILLPHFIHESFALGHTGCFENRFIISEEPATPKQVDALQKAFLDFWGSRLSNKQTQALLHQKNLYESSFEGAKIHSSEGGLLIPYLSKAADFRRVLSSAPFCLPVISADTYRSLEVPSEVSVDQRVCSNKDPKINAQFDGMHQGKGLFKPS
jgi:hypothetical protein